MAVLGKRKAAAEPSMSEQEAADIFRKHFESQFAPLEGRPSTTSQQESTESDGSTDPGFRGNNSDDSEGDESEWGGLSDGNSNVDDANEDESSEDEEEPVIEVVDHSASSDSKQTTMSKRELKAFMSSRPPDTTVHHDKPSSSAKLDTNSLPEDAPSLLAQDLELRRLIAESHLLSSKPATSLNATPSAPKSFAAGRTRQRATDMRVQALGSKASILTQERMPMAMRKGIASAAAGREAKRRREAKENGVVLERDRSKSGKKQRSRDMGLDRPGVGRMRGAQLSLSDRDVRKIEGGRDVFGRKGKR